MDLCLLFHRYATAVDRYDCYTLLMRTMLLPLQPLVRQSIG